MKESFPTCKKSQHVENASFSSVCFFLFCTCVKIELNQSSCCLPSGLSYNCIQRWSQDSFFSSIIISIGKMFVNLILPAARSKLWFPDKINLWSIYIHLCQSYFLTSIDFLMLSLTYLSKADLYWPVFLASTGCISFALYYN